MAVSRRRTTRSSRSSNSSSRSLGNVETNIKKVGKKFKTAGWIKVEDGESAIVRVIDVGADFRDGWVHPVEFSRKGRGSFTRDIMCLDQDDDGTPCPGCRDDLDRRYKFWTRAIEREAEVENSSGKVTGYEDQVKILSGGKRLAGALNKKHKKRSLDKRDIEIERDGTGWDTDYTVEWAEDEDSPLTRAEQKLIDESEIDLDRYASIPDFDDFYELPDRDDKDEDEDRGGRSIRRGSSFSARKSQRDSDNNGDDDDDDDDDRPRRRSSRKLKSGGGLADLRARKAGGNSGKPAIRRRRTNR